MIACSKNQYPQLNGTHLSVVVPTRNEEGNVARLIPGIQGALRLYNSKLKYDILLVDDSTDKTREVAEELGASVIKGRGMGLGQAIVDGISQSRGMIVAVMDADLSHQPRDLPRLIAAVEVRGYDMAIGSRYCGSTPGIMDGGVRGWPLKRRIISRGASLLGELVTGVRDATSGFFVVRKRVLEDVELSADSWKIMLEIVVKARPKWVEVPIVFEDRSEGVSKFNRKEVTRYLTHLRRLWWHEYRRIGIGALAPVRVWSSK